MWSKGCDQGQARPDESQFYLQSLQISLSHGCGPSVHLTFRLQNCAFTLLLFDHGLLLFFKKPLCCKERGKLKGFNLLLSGAAWLTDGLTGRLLLMSGPIQKRPFAWTHICSVTCSSGETCGRNVGH